MKRSLTIILFVVLYASTGASFVASAQGTEILWDTWGVPHIFANNEAGAFYAFGKAQMHSHGDLILRLYGQARGRASEYWGQNYFESDKWVRTMGVPGRAARWYQEQSPSFRKDLDAFADGINAYASEHPNQISDDVKIVLPVTPVDVIAHAQRVVHFTFVVNPGVISGVTRQWPGNGSNGWAIGPARSKSGKAMLLANPHLPWSDLFMFYEAQITAPGVNAYGATLVGFPVLVIAFNNDLGWTHTVNTIDGQDLYELSLVDGGYQWDGRPRAFESRTEVIKVKQPDGSLKENQLVVKESIHGPVVTEKNDKALALRVVGLDHPGMLEEWWDMNRATNLKSFEAVLKRMQIPMFNVIYADRRGHIMYLFNGLVPRRPKGDFAYWQGIVPGNTSATLWTTEHRYEDLPKLIDPPSHWLQNTNDPPWTATYPRVLDSRRFPSYMSPNFLDFRSQRSIRMISSENQLTLEQLIKDKHSSRMELADRLVDPLIRAAQQFGSETAKAAARVLEAWDRSANADSRGAVLFLFWAREMKILSPASKAFASPWNEKNPLATPDGLADPKAAVAALETAAQKVKTAYGAFDVAWGEVARLHLANGDAPANGGPGNLGIFRVVEYGQTKDGHLQAGFGDSFVSVVEFSNPVRARVLLTYGNASQKGSPHAGDQLKLFSQQELRPVWRTRKEIEANLESRESVQVTGHQFQSANTSSRTTFITNYRQEF
ncbi:MAG TPA: acylase [Pyrinomonadaceae bacterium]|nr:acylase [Pyrinomonadaceae bacterium]